MNKNDVEIDWSMLDDFKDIKIKNVEEEKIYFEIAGYPHYENVISNILAFFFDSQEQHNMNELWIKSLIVCYEDIVKKDVIKEINGFQLNYDEDIREHNANKNRIDIFIVLEKAIIVIENKIYASDDKNPYEDYHNEAIKTAEKYGIDKNNIYEILLSIDERENKIDLEKGYAFYNIQYEDLFKEIKKNIGNYILKVNEKWLIFQNEFIKNIENFYKETKMDLNINIQKKLESKNNEIKKIIDIIYNDIAAKKNHFNCIKTNIENINIENIENIGVTGTRTQSLNAGFFSIYIDIKNKAGNRIAIEPYICTSNPTKLFLEIWNRDNIGNYEWNEEKQVLEDMFKEPGIQEKNDGSWGNVLLLKEYDLSKEEDFKKVEEFDKVLIDIIKKLTELYKQT